jgi:ribosome biogenesis protein UTP30
MKKPSSTKTESSPARVDAQLINKAVGALLKHHTGHYEKKNDLLGNDSIISVHFGLDKVPTHSSPKPKRITIPHSLYKTGGDDAMGDDEDLEEPSVCLIVKEDSKEWIQELIAQFPKEMGLVKKVLGLDSLRKKHAKFAQQRALLDRFDVFLADDRILPMLAKACGKHFFTAKKQPLPICVTRKTSLPSVILQSLRSTYWYLSQGTCLAVKVGTTAMPAKHVMENIIAVCAHVPLKIPRQWANVRSIAIKTTHSTSLPIYNKTPAELNDIAEMAGLVVEKPLLSTEEQEKKEAQAAKAAKEAELAKKKRKAKSPLVKALKKQQEQEDTTTESKAKKQKTATPDAKKAKTTKASSTKKKRKELEVATKVEEEEQQSPEKKRKLSMDKKEATPTPKSAVKKTRSSAKKEEEAPKSSAKKAKVETPKAASAKKAKVETPKAASAKKTKAETPKSAKNVLDEPYVSAKKFKGSKKGYVFKMGTKGLGYYVDIKPKIDPMAMEALMRLGSKSKGKGGGSNSGKKPSRRSRR